MRQAIVTKYLGPTNHRGARVVARAQAGRKVVSWRDDLEVDENHTRAAEALASHYGWLDNTQLVGGAMPDGTGNCYVLVRRADLGG